MAQFPIRLDCGQRVGKVIIQSDRTKAIEAAADAAYNISSTNDVQFCPFVDGSYKHGRGGVALVYRKQWLPEGWTSDQNGTYPTGDFSKQAWFYADGSAPMVMEGVGILESFHAANKTIARDLQVLKTHDSTVTVKVTSDCDGMIRYVASNAVRKSKPSLTVPPKLIEMIREEIQLLHGHGIEVIAELHWCPRNQVPQLEIADDLAGKAMSSGLGFTNADKAQWSKTIKSDMALEIEQMLIWKPPIPVKAPEVKTSDPPTAPPTDSTEMSKGQKRRAKKRRFREAARAAAASADDSDAHPQLQLPAIPLPTKPGNNVPAVNSSTVATPSLAQPALESPQDEHLAKKQATDEAVQGYRRRKFGKRKAEDELGGGRPTKKAKTVHQPRTMPASWGLDPETTVDVWNSKERKMEKKSVVSCPFIREVEASTMETGEKNVFINDGFSGFSMVKPRELEETARPASAV